MKFIRFKEEGGEIKSVYNHKGEYIGWIEFQGKWKVHKQFIFCANEDTFFTAGCLKEIMDKLNELNKKLGGEE